MGRVVHTARALPAIWPVSFVLLPDAVYVRASPSSGVWQAAGAGAVVAFEADDVVGQHGWSVVVIGRAELVTDPLVLVRLGDVVPAPWATGPPDEVVRIPLELVDGGRARSSASASASGDRHG